MDNAANRKEQQFQVLKQKCKQLEAKNKQLRNALLNIAECSITANTTEDMSNTARQALSGKKG